MCAQVDELRGTPMAVSTLEEMIDDSHAIVSSSVGPEFYVSIMSFVDKDQVDPRFLGNCLNSPVVSSELVLHEPTGFPLSVCWQIEPGCTVLTHNKTLAVVGLLGDDVDPMVNVMKVLDESVLSYIDDVAGCCIMLIIVALCSILVWRVTCHVAQVDKAPTETFADIGGLETQIQEIKEAVELPLTHPELYEDIGIKPPKGVILYGEPGKLHHCLCGLVQLLLPGTGKTLLAKAVANSTAATFLRVVGSELIQKYLGDGPKLVRELFRVAEEQAPTIVFIDEIDAVGTKR